MSEGTPISPDIFSKTDGNLAATTIKKLEKAGITTMEQLAYSTPKEIIDLTQIGKETAEKAVLLAQQAINPGFITADKLHERLPKIAKCSTGSKQFDRILGGGISVGIITELIGEFSGGKTQTCFTLSVLAPLPREKGGLGGKVVYLDTEGTFEKGGTERIIQIAKTRGINPDEALKNIIWARAYNSIHQETLIKNLDGVCRENHVRMIIVDSMLAHLRGEYLGRGTLADRQGMLGGMLGKLLRIAGANNVAIVITNQVQAKVDGSAAYGDPNQAAGGHVMAHAATIRCRFWKGRANTRLVSVIDSSYLPEEKVRVAITEGGIVDEDGSFKNVEDTEGES
jgi:DNA repair protein RadA